MSSTSQDTKLKSSEGIRLEDELLYPDDIVEISVDHAQSPLKWSIKKRIAHTVAYGLTTFSAQFNASVLSPGLVQISREFHVGVEVATLSMSLYVLGNGLGPMLFAPVSELYGRKVGVLLPYMVSAILEMITACVDSISALIILRFFSGVFAAAPIVSSGAAMADLWDPSQRGSALVLYSIFIVLGSTTAPIFGALLVDTGSYGWRWCCWLGGILGFIIALTNYISLDETFRPILGVRMARRLRVTTGRWALRAHHEEWRLDWQEFFNVHCARPLLLFLTPIVFLMASFASFSYGLMFLVIDSVGENFHNVKQFEGAAMYCPLLSSFLGFLFGGVMNVFNSQYYAKKMKDQKIKVTPEDRLYSMMTWCWTLSAGCFIYGWTLDEHIHWVIPCIGLFLLGIGIATIFQGALNYIVDCYTRYAASAIAANTLLRSIYGGIFPLFARQLYSTLGIHWGTSLMGFFGLALIPVPFVFFLYGERARNINPYERFIS